MSTVQIRVWDKLNKVMHNPSTGCTLVLSGSGFNVLTEDESVPDESNSVLMRGCNFKDKKGVDIYEGDVVYFKRKTLRGFLPVVGVISQKDFTFQVVSAGISFMLDYSDKELEVLGNVFENTDEELAKATENKLKHFTAKGEKK